MHLDSKSLDRKDQQDPGGRKVQLALLGRQGQRVRPVHLESQDRRDSQDRKALRDCRERTDRLERKDYQGRQEQ